MTRARRYSAIETGDHAIRGMSGTRLYYLHPLLAGPIGAWRTQLDRIAAMRFDTVVVAPPFATGRDGDLFLSADHDRLDSRLGAGSALTALARFAGECRERELWPMLDVVVDRIAAEHATNSLSSWYRVDSADELPDPRQPPHQAGVARLMADADLAGLVEWWTKRFIEWVDAGIADFRCLRPDLAPAQLWHEMISVVRRPHPQTSFMASAFEVAKAGV